MTQTLTRKQIKDMQPGSNLDLLVETKVRGKAEDRHRPGNVLDGTYSTRPKEYSKDMSAAWEVEEKIKELRLQGAYCQALKQVVIGTGEYVGLFDYIHATPEQRCKAALLAVLDI